MKRLLVVLVALLSACASPSPPPSRPASPSDPAPVGDVITVRGQVARGVEPGCLLLVGADEREWLLVGGDRNELAPGRTVTVQGVFRSDVVTTCQQGRPLLVRSVTVD